MSCLYFCATLMIGLNSASHGECPWKFPPSRESRGVRSLVSSLRRAGKPLCDAAIVPCRPWKNRWRSGAAFPTASNVGLSCFTDGLSCCTRGSASIAKVLSRWSVSRVSRWNVGRILNVSARS